MRRLITEFKLRRMLKREFDLLMEATSVILPEYYDEVYQHMSTYDVAAALATINKSEQAYFQSLQVLTKEVMKGGDQNAHEALAEVFEATQGLRMRLAMEWNQACAAYLSGVETAALLRRYRIKFKKRT